MSDSLAFILGKSSSTMKIDETVGLLKKQKTHQKYDFYMSHVVIKHVFVCLFDLILSSHLQSFS